MTRLKFVIVIFFAFAFPVIASAGETIDPIPNQINAVRFDPSYYYDSDFKLNDMCEQLAEEWHDHGVNLVYFKVYDPVYGAKYRTSYAHNVMADYGRQDLLKHMLSACEKNNIRVFAWIPAFQHRSAWEKHPEWRVRSADGSDYQPSESSYSLCPAHPDFQRWWLGFLKDLLVSYKNLQGVDIAEPIITWNSHRCYCDHCAHAGDEWSSSLGLTQILSSSVRLIRGFDIESCITTVASAHPDGRLFTQDELKQLTGFDPEGILDGDAAPDYINLELMWQQWAELFNDSSVFTPEWAEKAGRNLLQRINNRTTVIGHLELTSFGRHPMDADQLVASIKATRDGGIQHIDIYDTHLIDGQNAWQKIGEAFDYVKTKKVLVSYDPPGENDARQIASWLSHFHTEIQLHQVMNQPLPSTQGFDHIFYIGVDPRFIIPEVYLKELNQFGGNIVWIHYGVQQYLSASADRHHGFHHVASAQDTAFDRVIYKGIELPRMDPAFNIVSLDDSTTCRVFSEISDGNLRYPYVVQSENLWYFADLPTAFVTEGGRHIVFSDLLHDILEEDHLPRKIALVRIEDIHPSSDISSLREIADRLDVPFAISVVPFYLDPESNTAVSMSDRPEFIEAIQHMIRSGGTVVMHGITHQFRGETTADYEFWDTMAGAPLFSDSKEYVRQRMLTGLAEFKKANIYPLLWETPHYGASQLDYSVINQFFSTAYERRQTVNLHGSDLLTPYVLRQHTSGGKIIPENMGYIPLGNPDPGPMLQAAQNYLALRDGVASFFFHPFVDHEVLESIISGMKKLGYTFTSPRNTDNWVRSPDFAVLSGRGSIDLQLDDHYLHEFFIDERGRIRNEFLADTAASARITKEVHVPEGWIYIAERLSQKPGGFISRSFQKLVPVGMKTSNPFTEKKDLQSDPNGQPLRIALLFNSLAHGRLATDQANFANALRSVGVDFRLIEVTDFLEIPEFVNLLIIPYATSSLLTEQQQLFLLHALQNGLNLVLEKNSRLSESIGITPLKTTTIVKEVIDEYYPQVAIQWKQADTLTAVDVDIDYVTYYSDRDSQTPLVIGGEYGEGKYLYFGTLFDPETNGGYGRFPYFIDLLNRQFGLLPSVRRNALEIYFEPGDREEISIEDLVKMWRGYGVRKIYASGWHFYQKYTYDYERLIRLAHQNGMLVYAWLELPHVSDKFWEDHPEWREKSATGRDAKVDWRKLMALNIADCREAVFTELRELLTRYDWDGINFAELYYESPLGYSAPDNFTPMNDPIRMAFQKSHGFDPKLLFNPQSAYYWKRNSEARGKFNRYREEYIIALHEEFMDFLTQLKSEHGLDWEIILTTIDDILSPSTGEATAVNTMRIAEIAKQYQATLQIEDPQPLWHMGPDRYGKILDAYASIRDQIPLILDINIVPYRDLKYCQAPTAQPTGMELYNLARAAGEDQTRVALYSEASIYEIDFPMMSYVMAADASEEFQDDMWTVESPFTVNLSVDPAIHKDVLMDGEIWPACDRGRILIPKGRHRIESFSGISGWIHRFKSGTRLVDLSGELIHAEIMSRGIVFDYESKVTAYVILTDDPKEIIIDGKSMETEVQKGDLGYAFRLPAGTHRAKIYTQTAGTQFMKHASIIISGLIVSIGFFAGTMLSTIYFIHSFRRKRNSKGLKAQISG